MTSGGDFVAEEGRIVAIHFASFCAGGDPTLSIDGSTPMPIYQKLGNNGTKAPAGLFAWGNGDVVQLCMFSWGWLILGPAKADPNQMGVARLRDGLDDDDPLAAVNQRVLKAALDGKVSKTGDTMTGPLQTIAITLASGIKTHRIAVFGERLIIANQADATVVVIPTVTSGTLALTAGEGHEGNLAAIDANGNPIDSQIAKNDIVTMEELEDGIATNEIEAGGITIDGKECATKDLVGQSFDVTDSTDVQKALAAIITALGGEARNVPTA